MASQLGSASVDVFAKLYASSKLTPAGDSIRCLTVFKGTGDARVRCRLETHTKPFGNNKPSYVAVSYTWGNPSKKAPVYINGLRCWVSANAHTALKDLRSVDEDKLVWIDAICIDQDDEAEKNAQVAIMRKIYSNSTDINIWLGEPSEDSDLALDFLENFAQNKDNSRWLDEVYTSPRYDASWEALRRIFERPYWDRVWVLQECSVKPNPTVQIGRRAAPFSHFLNLASLVTKAPQPPPFSKALEVGDWLPVAITLPSLTSRSCDPHRALRLLAMGRFQECSRAHDRIYGILGVFPSEHQFKMPIAYNKSVETVYVDTARSLIRHTQSLDILGHCEPSSTSRDLPSWCPDWHTRRRIGSVAPVYDSLKYRKYSACKELEAVFEFDPRGRLLTVEGFLVDVIGAIGTAYHPVGTELCQADQCAMDTAPSDEGDYVLHPDLEHLRAVMHTWLQDVPLGTSSRGLSRRSTQEPEEEEHLLGTLDDNQSQKAATQDRSGQSGPITERLLNVHPRAYNRSFFKSRQLGLFGLAPDNAQSRDLVCVIKGCSVPMILRQEEDSDYCTVVGEAFVQGLMFGEGIFGLDQREFKLK